MSPSPLLLVAAAAALLSRAGAAQTVEGVLLDRDGRTPVAGAHVALLGIGNRVAAEASTDTAGRFSLTAPGAGLYRVSAEPAGGATILFPALALATGERLSFEFHAQAPAADSTAAAAAAPAGRDSAIALPAVVGVAEMQRRLLERNGFYQRRHLYPGRFLEREQFLALHGFRLTQKIQDLGILLEVHGAERFRPYRVYRASRCYIAMYIDGAPVNDLSVLLLTNDMVAGVEYYTRDDIPPEWNPYKGDPNWRCGSLVIWTQPPDAASSPRGQR
ncbi:MAG TPA: carboxypeptidase-like regulatory domain-containing protein [Longimicrobiaceae bacterium]